VEPALQLYFYACALCVFSHSSEYSCTGERAAKQSLRIAKWVFAAIVAPELVVYTASQQWSWARRISKELGELRFEQEKSLSRLANSLEAGDDAYLQLCEQASMMSQMPTSGLISNFKQANAESNNVRSTSFSLIYGFYVVMGSLTVDVSDIRDSFPRLTLTLAGALYLARQGLFKMVSHREIWDKSKADILEKGLVVLQVTWMILQCISIKVAGYPLSALELRTLVHACCALIMYY